MIAEIGLLRHFGDRAMRRIAIVSLLFLQGCSSTDVEIPPVVMPTVVSPTQSAAIIGAQKAANDAKLVGPVEISAVRKASPLGPGQYQLCIKGTNAQTGTRPYAVFFNNDTYVAMRSSVILDECDTETFTSFGTGPFSVQPDKPKPG